VTDVRASTLVELRAMSLAELEALWTRPVALSAPRGIYHGHVLQRIDHATSRRPLWRWSERLGFVWIPFGVDFDRRLWFFFNRRVAMGHFQTHSGESRWRDTDAIGLSYERSRLPGFVRDVLYDEVKPLSARLILGIGGINRDRGEGEHFFFALEKT